MNESAERAWRTLNKMAIAYITEKQVGKEFWYFAVRHAEIILNQVQGRLGLKLTTSFELVLNAKPDFKTWFELLSIEYFNHRIGKNEIRTKLKAHTLCVIAVGRDDNSNYIFL